MRPNHNPNPNLHDIILWFRVRRRIAPPIIVGVTIGVRVKVVAPPITVAEILVAMVVLSAMAWVTTTTHDYHTTTTTTTTKRTYPNPNVKPKLQTLTLHPNPEP